jgi:hypothetical protein
MITPQQGTFDITFTPNQKDWSTDIHTYLLGEYMRGDISLKATKHADRTLELNISGLLGKTFTLRLPQPPGRELKLDLTWENDLIELFMNGKLLKVFIASQMRTSS